LKSVRIQQAECWKFARSTPNGKKGCFPYKKGERDEIYFCMKRGEKIGVSQDRGDGGAGGKRKKYGLSLRHAKEKPNR